MNRRQILKLGAVTLATSCFSILHAHEKKESVTPQLYWPEIDVAIKKQARQHKELRLLYPKGSYDNIKVITDAFEQQFGVKIIAIEAAINDIASEMMLQHSVSKNYFDIALPPTFSIPNLSKSQIIQDLTDFAVQYEPPGYFDSSLYQQGDRFLGRLYGYQADGDAYLMFYNSGFINDANNQKRYEDQHQTQLVLPKRWTELDQQIRFFSQPEKGLYGGSLFRNKSNMVAEFWIRLHARGLYPVSADMTPQINRDEAVEELEKMVRLNPYLDPSVHKNEIFENFESFAQGHNYCNMGWGGTQKYIVHENAPIKNQLAWSPALSYDENSAFPYTPFYNWGWNYVVSSKSKKAELAYLFCLFASSASNSTQSVQQSGGYFDPHREEHYHDSVIVKTYGKDFLAAHEVSLKNSIPDFYIQGQAQYMSALRQGVFNVSQGRMKAKRALNLVAKHWDKLTDAYGRDQQIQQWQSLSKSYPAFFKKTAKKI